MGSTAAAQNYYTDLLIGITTSNFSGLNPFFDLYEENPFSLSTFSFQDALRPTITTWRPSYDDGTFTEVNNPIYLFTDGCNNNGTQNCNVSCFDQSTIFSNLSTFHNCAAYPMVAQLYADGNLSASANDNALVDGLGIQKSRQGSELLTNVTSTITNCLQSLCAESTLCKETLGEQSQSSVFNSTSAFFFMNSNTDQSSGTSTYDDRGSPTEDSGPFDFANDLCSLQTAGLNSDVGGIGVRTAHTLLDCILLSE